VSFHVETILHRRRTDGKFQLKIKLLDLKKPDVRALVQQYLKNAWQSPANSIYNLSLNERFGLMTRIQFGFRTTMTFITDMYREIFWICWAQRS